MAPASTPLGGAPAVAPPVLVVVPPVLVVVVPPVLVVVPPPLQTYFVCVTSPGSSTPSPLVSRPVWRASPPLAQLGPAGSGTTLTKLATPLHT